MSDTETPNHFTRCTTVEAAPRIPLPLITAIESGSETDEPAVEIPIKPEVFLLNDDYPHIIQEKGFYYVLHRFENETAILLSEKKKAYYLDLAKTRHRSSSKGYFKVSPLKEIQAIKETGGLRQMNAGTHMLRGFQCPTPAHLSLLAATSSSLDHYLPIPQSYFYGNVKALKNPFLIGRVNDSDPPYETNLKFYNLVNPIALSQAAEHPNQILPAYKSEVGTKADESRIRHLLHDFESLLENHVFLAVIHYQRQKHLLLTEEQKEEIQSLIDKSEPPPPQTTPTYRFPFHFSYRQGRSSRMFAAY